MIVIPTQDQCVLSNPEWLTEQFTTDIAFLLHLYLSTQGMGHKVRALVMFMSSALKKHVEDNVPDTGKVEVSEITETSVKLKWHGPMVNIGPHDMFAIAFGKTCGYKNTTESCTVREKEHTVTELDQGTKYYIYVRTVREIPGDPERTLGSIVQEVSVRTAPSKPHDLKWKATTSTVKLTWDQQGRADRYIVKWKKVGSNDRNELIETGDKYYTIEGLSLGSKDSVHVSVQAVSGDDFGKHAETIVTLDNITDDAIKLVSSKTGDNWPKLAHALFSFQDPGMVNTTEKLIDDLQQEMLSDEAKCKIMLNKWAKESLNSKPSKEILISALKTADLFDVVNAVEKNADNEIDFRDVEIVSSLVGLDWEKLAYHLFSFQDASKTKSLIIDDINNKGRETLQQKCFEMLLRWRQEAPNSSKENLIKALEESKMRSVVRKLERKD